MFIAGDSLRWTRVVSSYPPADGWSLHYRLVGPSDLLSQPVVTVVNGAYQVDLAAAATADPDFAAGAYRMIGYVDGVSAERHVIFDGYVEIQANVAVQSFASMQSHEERMIVACEARLEGRMTTDVARYGREGAFVDKLDFAEIRHTLGIYKAKLWRRQNPGESFPQHAVRFSSVSGNSTDENIGWPGYQP